VVRVSCSMRCYATLLRVADPTLRAVHANWSPIPTKPLPSTRASESSIRHSQPLLRFISFRLRQSQRFTSFAADDDPPQTIFFFFFFFFSTVARFFNGKGPSRWTFSCLITRTGPNTGAWRKLMNVTGKRRVTHFCSEGSSRS